MKKGLIIGVGIVIVGAFFVIQDLGYQTNTDPNAPDPNANPEKFNSAKASGADEISSQVILETNLTVIGQDISYPSGSPQITSKIVIIPVGAETGPHIHEYPMFAYIMEGEVSVDYGEQGIKTFVKGQSIVEAINYTHNGRNNGNEPTKILVVLMGKDKN